MKNNCKICEGSGIYFDINIKTGSVGELKICPHVEKICGCGGFPPYQIFDNKGIQSWCPCRSVRIRLAATKKAFKEAQIPKKYIWKFIDDFKPVSSKADLLVSMVSTIRGKSDKDKWNVGYYFWGKPGSGKTLLACIMLQELMLKYNTGGKFVDLSRQFFQKLKSSFNVGDESYGKSGKILDDLIEIPFLIVDDFGVQKNTEWESEMLYTLLDARYAEERPTIITSNIPITDFKEVAHGRIYSRIHEMTKIIHFDLPDYREKFAQSMEIN